MAIDEQEQAIAPDAIETESSPIRGDLTYAAGAWVFMGTFAGIAVGWSSNLITPGLGGVIGGSLAFALGTLVIAFRG